MNLSLQVWSCHSASCIAARGGRAGGHVIGLVMVMERCGLREAGLRLQDWFGVGPSTPALARPAVSSSVVESNRPLGFALRGIDSRHPYLTQRGISLVTALLFGVGMYRGNGFLAGRCVIPIRDENGQLVAYAGRAVKGEEPKYRFPAGFRKSQVLFNLDRAIETGGRNVIVVEGFFDTLKVHQAGHPGVVALMGCSFSSTPVRTSAPALRQRHIDAGWGPTRAPCGGIRRPIVEADDSCSQVDLPDSLQPDQLSSVEIK